MLKSLRKRLQDGETLIGSLVTLQATNAAEIMALTGFDYLWIDAEHSSMDFARVESLIQAVGGRCPCLVRIPENREVWIKKALDTGCDGIVIPQVNSAEEAREALAASFYPPRGRRSVGISRAQAFGMSFQEYVGRANEDLTIVLQIENIAAVERIASIAAEPGIGALLVGPYDLSGTVGLLGQVAHPRVQEAIETVRQQCLASKVPLGIFAADAAAGRQYVSKGFQLVAVGMDTFFLAKAARATLDEMRRES
jgi:2-keto-3-deoxy-L-rhamnonate aldolase RhmA